MRSKPMKVLQILLLLSLVAPMAVWGRIRPRPCGSSDRPPDPGCVEECMAGDPSATLEDCECYCSGDGGGDGGDGGDGAGGSGNGNGNNDDSDNPGNGNCGANSIKGYISLGRVLAARTDTPDTGFPGRSVRRLAGRLIFLEEAPGERLSTPAILKTKNLDASVRVYYSDAGFLDQLISQECIADIEVVSADKFEVRFYQPSAASSSGSGPVTGFSSAPFITWTFENPDGSASHDRLRVTDGRRTWLFAWDSAAQTWTLQQGNGIGLYSVQVTWNAERTEQVKLFTVSDVNGLVVSERRDTYTVYPWGTELTRRVLDPNGAALTTRWEYYDDPAAAGSYKKLKKMVEPTGKWTRYEYDDQGRRTLVLRPWKNSPETATAAEADATRYDYVSVDSGDVVVGGDTRYRTVTREVLGVPVAKTYYAYVNTDTEQQRIVEKAAEPGYAYGHSDNLRTVSTYSRNSGTSTLGPLKNVVYPDGRMVSYEYADGTYAAGPDADHPGTFTESAGGSCFRETVTHGTADHPDGLAGKTTRQVRIYNGVNRLVQEETYVYASGDYQRVDWIATQYDARYNAVAVIYANGTRRDRNFVQGTSLLQSEVDPTGQKFIYTYDAVNRIATRTKEGVFFPSMPNQYDVVTAYVYNPADNLLSVTTTGDALSHVASSEYDKALRRTRSVDAAGLATEYGYAEGGRQETVVLPGGGTQTRNRYLDGRPLDVSGTATAPRFYDYGVDNDGHLWTIEFEGPAGVNSPRWNRSTFDALGRTLRVEKPGFGGGTVATVYEYNDKGQLAIVRTLADDDPIQAAALYEYDELGRSIRTTLDANGNDSVDLAGPDRVNESEIHFVWTGGRWWETVTSKIYPGNDSTPVSVSTQWRKISGSGCACTAQILKTVDAWGNPTTLSESIDSALKTVTATKDVPDSDADPVSVSVNGLLQSRADSDGRTTTYSYDALGRPTHAVDSRTGLALTHYNALGQVDYVVDAAGKQTSYEYDADSGRRLTVTDALGNASHVQYDLQGRVTNVWGATYPVAYEYDAYGRLAAMKTWRDANGEPDVTRWNYDEATGLLTNKVYADGTGPSYEYDAAGRLTKRIWARGVETAYAYDGLGQLTGIDYSDSTPDVAFTYDRLGRQLTVADVLGTRTNVYDAVALMQEQKPDGETLARTYDAFGRPSGISLGAEYAVGYSYDSNGRLAGVLAPGSVEVEYAYVPGSRLLAGWGVADGPSASYAYEYHRDLKTGVANAFDGDPISSFVYANDAIGRRTQRVDSAATANVFGYNARSELTAATMGADLYAYAYDTIGNRQQASANAVATTYAANELNQYVDIDEGAVVPTYDADGNMLSYGSKNYTWDAENRLVRAAPRVLVTGSKIYDYVYDYRSRRIKKTERRHTMMESTWTKRTFDYDDWNLVRERVEFNGEIATNHYVWGLDLSGSQRGAGGVGGLLMQRRSDVESPWFSFCDANGNVTDLVDDEGTVVAHYEYDPYGNTANQSGDGADANPFRFSTKYWDNENGFYYYGFRHYSPQIGCWISRDPVGNESFLRLQLANLDRIVRLKREKQLRSAALKPLYRYVDNRSISEIDPLGLDNSGGDGQQEPFDPTSGCWIDPPERICGTGKSLRERCCRLGVEAIMMMDPGAHCQASATACEGCCTEKFTDDPTFGGDRFELCVNSCELKRVACTGGL